MKDVMREPLVHFLIIGGLLFVLFNFLNNPVGPQTDRIVITTGQIDYLKANFVRTWQRSPTEKELQVLTESFVRDEIFYREALAMGLDREDSVIRRRLKQKLEILSDDLASVTIPTEEELIHFLKTHPKRFTTEPQVAFRHIFISSDLRGQTAHEEAQRLLSVVSSRGSSIDPNSLGDGLMLPRSFDCTGLNNISRLFGDAFGREISRLHINKWAGPIASGYGLHIVYVTQQVKGRLPKLAEIRDAVEREWYVTHKKELKDGLYEKLREKYIVVFDLVEQTATEKSK